MGTGRRGTAGVTWEATDELVAGGDRAADADRLRAALRNGGADEAPA